MSSVSMPTPFQGKIEVPKDVQNQKLETGQAEDRLISTSERMQVPNGAGQGVRMSKRPNVLLGLVNIVKPETL